MSVIWLRFIGVNVRQSLDLSDRWTYSIRRKVLDRSAVQM